MRVSVMGWFSNPVLVGRLAVIPLAFVEWCAVLVLLSCVDIYPKRSWQRVTVCVAFIVAVISIVAAQIHGYQWITSRRHATDDDVVGVVIIAENFFSFFLMVFISKRKAKSSPNIG
jgi:hypothetical protein